MARARAPRRGRASCSSATARRSAAPRAAAGLLARRAAARRGRRRGARAPARASCTPTTSTRRSAGARSPRRATAGARAVLHLHNYRLVCAVGTCFNAAARTARAATGATRAPGVRLNCRGTGAEAAVYAAALALWQRRLVAAAPTRSSCRARSRCERLRALRRAAGRAAACTSSATSCATSPTRSRAARGPPRARRRRGWRREKGVDDGDRRLRAGRPAARRRRRRAASGRAARRAPRARDVRFAGRVGDARARARCAPAAALALVPSRAAETFGLAAAEAMAAGLPVGGDARRRAARAASTRGARRRGDAAALAAAAARAGGDAARGRRAAWRASRARGAAPEAVAARLAARLRRARPGASQTSARPSPDSAVGCRPRCAPSSPAEPASSARTSSTPCSTAATRSTSSTTSPRGRESNLARRSPARHRPPPRDIRDGRAPDARSLAADRPDIVFHLAAQIDVRRSIEDPAYDARVNVGGTINVLEAARLAGVRRLVNTSTGGAIYGDADVMPTPETVEPRPMAAYGQSKFCAERVLRLYGRLYGMAAVTLRYGNVYGPRQDPHGEAGVIAIFAGTPARRRAGRRSTATAARRATTLRRRHRRRQPRGGRPPRGPRRVQRRHRAWSRRVLEVVAALREAAGEDARRLRAGVRARPRRRGRCAAASTSAGRAASSASPRRRPRRRHCARRSTPVRAETPPPRPSRRRSRLRAGGLRRAGRAGRRLVLGAHARAQREALAALARCRRARSVVSGSSLRPPPDGCARRVGASAAAPRAPAGAGTGRVGAGPRARRRRRRAARSPCGCWLRFLRKATSRAAIAQRVPAPGGAASPAALRRLARRRSPWRPVFAALPPACDSLQRRVDLGEVLDRVELRPAPAEGKSWHRRLPYPARRAETSARRAAGQARRRAAAATRPSARRPRARRSAPPSPAAAGPSRRSASGACTSTSKRRQVLEREGAPGRGRTPPR